MTSLLTVIISLIIYGNCLCSQEDNVTKPDKNQAVELLSHLLREQVSVLPQEIKLRIKKELLGECYLENDDLLWGIKIIPSRKRIINNDDQQIGDNQKLKRTAQADYWYNLRRSKEIFFKEGIFYDSYFFQGQLIAKESGAVRGIGPNKNGLVIIKNNDSLYLIPKAKTHSMWSWQTPSQKISIDPTSNYAQCCMHRIQNAWATAQLTANTLSITHNLYNRLIISMHKAFGCDDSTLHSIHYDYVDKQGKTLLVLTDQALYHAGKSLQKLLSINDLINKYIHTKWVQHKADYTCEYEASYQRPNYFILRFQQKYVHPTPRETYSLLFKRSAHNVSCKLVFADKIGFLQKPSFLDGYYNFNDKKKLPRRMLVLRDADDVIKEVISSLE